MVRWKLVTGVALIFVCGAFTGVLGTGVYLRYRLPMLFESPEDHKNFMKTLIMERLQLAEEQKPEIMEILDQMHEDIESEHHKHHDTMKKVERKWFAKIRTKLTPEQKTRLDALERELRAKFDEMKKPPPPPLPIFHR